MQLADRFFQVIVALVNPPHALMDGNTGSGGNRGAQRA